MFNRQIFEAFCIEKNIEQINAPATDHRAIGPVRPLIQSIKRQLSCMKAQLNENLILNMQYMQLLKEYDLRNKKTTNITPCEAHFGRQHNTPISNFTTKSNIKNLN